MSPGTHMNKQTEFLCEMDQQSGDTEFSLVSAMKKGWDLQQVPHFSGPQFPLTKMWVMSVLRAKISPLIQNPCIVSEGLSNDGWISNF